MVWRGGLFTTVTSCHKLPHLPLAPVAGRTELGSAWLPVVPQMVMMPHNFGSSDIEEQLSYVLQA